MLSWSEIKYKFTLGIGSLAIAGMLAELWQDMLPTWIAVAIALVPVILFVFVHPTELPTRFVGIVHVTASLWYFVATIGLLSLTAAADPLPRGWPIYPAFAAVGAVPCSIVLYQWVLGKYPPPVDSDGGSVEQDTTANEGEDQSI